MENDTITAISTPMGEGAISIVRLSGKNSVSKAMEIYRGADLHAVDTHTIHYGTIQDPETGELAEEVMVSVMRAPKTFTRENVVEINCHGGITAANRILQMILDQGVRLADPGEFTKRAFLNGRIDLSQAEAVMDVIRAKTDKAMNVAMEQMDGRLSRLIRTYRQTLLETVAHVEVNIDYPEYDDVEEMSSEMMRTKTKEVHGYINELLEIANQGKILREGISTAIIGRPNVGKSSLLNNFVHEDKAIVTEVPGTTRDVMEEYVNVRGVPLKLVDTAGIRETEDIVEKVGVDRSRKVLEASDLVLLVLNYNESLTEDDKQLFEAVQDLEYIVIINKTDLEQHLDIDEVEQLAENHPIVQTSLIGDAGMDELETAISQLFFSGNVENQDLTYVSNARHIQLLKDAKRALEDAMEALEMGMPLDIIQIDITRAWELLGEIVGDTASDGLIDQLFSQFCLGK